MSRFRRLKDRRRKNRIKATSYGLALALAVGSAQGLCTYALFTDTEKVPSDIALSTGDVDVGINEGTKFENIEPSSDGNPEIRIPVKITNYGTLNQNIKLDLIIPNDIKSNLEEVEYIFDGVKISKDTIEAKNGIMYNEENNSLFVLAPGDSIEGTIKMNIKEITKGVQNDLSTKPHIVEVKVKSTQISDNKNEVFNTGFYDEVTQTNTITIAPKEIITVAVGEKAHYINDYGNNYTSLYIPVNVNGITEENKDNIKITAKIEGSEVSYKAEYVDKGTYKYIKITRDKGGYIEFQDALNITINIKIGEDEEYSQLCWVKQENASNSNCEEENHPQGEAIKRCQIQVVNAGHKEWNTLEETPIPEEIEQPKEEVEVPSEPEVVEPPKEEVEVPSKPEAVEPPKEEVEVSTEPEVIEPPKENEEIQE